MKTNNQPLWHLQADASEPTPIDGGQSVAAAEISENVSFIDNSSGLSVSAAPALNHVAKVDNTDDLQLGNFFESSDSG